MHFISCFKHKEWQNDFHNIVITNITIGGMKVEPGYAQETSSQIGRENSKRITCL